MRQINDGDSVASNTGRDWTQHNIYYYRILKSNLGNIVSGVHINPGQRIKETEIGIDDFYVKYAEIKAFEKAQPRHHERILEWVFTRGPIYEDEQGFLFHRDDFMTTKKGPGTGNQSSRVHDWIEAWLTKHPDSKFNVSVDLAPVLPPHTLVLAD
jgi:hypothetical protein